MLSRSFGLLALVGTMLAQSTSPVYRIETLAGTDWNGDGQAATLALLVQPASIASDRNGYLYISDAADHRVRRIAPSGQIRTFAGTGVAGIAGDEGPATQAELNSPYGITTDSSGNLYIADLGNGRVRRVDSAGTMRTVAGGGDEAVLAGVPVQATRARLQQPRDVAIDGSGNLIISDFGAHMIYQVTPSGVLSVLAGTGEPLPGITGPTPATTAPLAFPAALAVTQSGAILIGDSANHRVRQLLNGTLTTLLDKRQQEIELSTPTGISVDSAGRIYIADGSDRITVVGAGGELSLLDIGGTDVFVTPEWDVLCTVGHGVRRLVGSHTEVVAGGENRATFGDGADPAKWRFGAPSSMVRDGSGYLWIADTANGTIRRLTPGGELRTITSALASPVSLAINSVGQIFAGDRATGSVYRLDGVNTPKLYLKPAAEGCDPAALAFDARDDLFVADAGNNVILRMSPDGSQTTIAGGGSQSGDGVAAASALSRPAGLAFDAGGSLWISEAGGKRIRKLSGDRISTLSGTDLTEPRGIRFDTRGKLWVADTGANRVVRIDVETGSAPAAGTGDSGFAGDGNLALAARLNGPADVLPEPDGSVLVADRLNRRIRRLLPTTGPEEELPASTPDPQAATVVLTALHAGSLKAEPVAPGQLVYIDGSSFTSSTVDFSGIPATILSSAATRLTVLVPESLRTGKALVKVRNGETPLGEVSVEVVAAAPALLTVDGGKGPALALNQDGSVNAANAPADRGSVISLFVTGQSNFTSLNALFSVYPADIVWAGPAPGLPGVMQVNLKTPGGFAPGGSVPVTLQFDDQKTQGNVTVYSR